MTDPTIPTTEAGRRMAAYLRQDWVRNFAADILAIEVEAAASALSALRAEVLHYLACDGSVGMFDALELAKAREALLPLIGGRDAVLAEEDRILGVLRGDRIAKAEPEGESRDCDGLCFVTHGHAEPEGESRG